MNPRWIAILCLAWAIASQAAPLTPEEAFFTDKVKPLLDSRCVACHGPDKVKGGLRMDARAALLKGGDSGPALAPGKPQESLLLHAVLHTKPDLEMPPKEKLTAKDIAILEQWIRQGAPWVATNGGDDPEPMPGEILGNAWSDPRNPIVKIFGGQRLDLWSLKPVAAAVPPRVRKSSWVRNPIDRFVLAKLEKEGLRPSKEASKRALVRRVTFDLTGLPPTPEEVDDFIADKRAGAYERLVDRLLASPRYGEHWSRGWLDVVRYSDSNGFDWDEFRPEAWRFRDYVIRSLNEDKPFDRFVTEQLAGDELLAGPPRTPAEQDCLIATGFLRLGPHDNSAALFGEEGRSRAELMTDLVETTSGAFLGMTLACARCHNHKYDPISQADHYRMRAFFEPVKFGDDLALDLPEARRTVEENNRRVEAEARPWREKEDDLMKRARERVAGTRRGGLSAAEKAVVAAQPETLAPDQKTAAEAARKKLEVSDDDAKAAFTKDEKAEREKIEKAIEELKAKKSKLTRGLLMTDAGGSPPVTKILYQGDYRQERAAVTPGFLSVLDPNPARVTKPANAKTTGRRLTLANWIVAPENPLTARVAVNRVWQGHFGKGLVATPNDFGLVGARPTHPELLDWLATEFRLNGWSLKKLHRLIVTSATYRQSSAPEKSRRGASQTAKDAENQWLWRQNLRRLSAEQLRDSLLAVSGKLLPRQGGPPAWPDLPQEVLRSNPAFLDDNAEKTKGWYPSPAGEQAVRSVYLVQKRGVKEPFMETFDQPDNSVSCPRRTVSVVAPQALSLLNSPEAVSAANAFAGQVRKLAGDDPAAQVRAAFRFALQRAPDARESRACLALLRERSLAEVCRALLNVNEFVYVD
jgi:cytochrome c553